MTPERCNELAVMVPLTFDGAHRIADGLLAAGDEIKQLRDALEKVCDAAERMDACPWAPASLRWDELRRAIRAARDLL